MQQAPLNLPPPDIKERLAECLASCDAEPAESQRLQERYLANGGRL